MIANLQQTSVWAYIAYPSGGIVEAVLETPGRGGGIAERVVESLVRTPPRSWSQTRTIDGIVVRISPVTGTFRYDTAANRITLLSETPLSDARAVDLLHRASVPSDLRT